MISDRLMNRIARVAKNGKTARRLKSVMNRTIKEMRDEGKFVHKSATRLVPQYEVKRRESRNK